MRKLAQEEAKKIEGKKERKERMKKKSSQIKNILLKVFLTVLLISTPIIPFVLAAYETPQYLTVIYHIYLLVMYLSIDDMFDILFPESEHTEEERKTEVNIEESKNQPKERTE